MTRIIRQFPSRDYDLETIWLMTKDLSDEQFKRAIYKILASYESLTKATNIIALIRKYSIDPESLTTPEAWAEVLQRVHSVGTYGTPRFSNARIKRAVECIGWRNICMSDNPGIERAHFFKAYQAIKDRDENEMINERVIGLVEGKDGEV